MSRLNAAQTALLLKEIQKNSGLTSTEFKPVVESIKTQYLKGQRELKRKQAVVKNDNALDQVLPTETMDMHLFRRVSGSRQLCVMSEAFYEYQSAMGYWQMVHDTTMKQLLQNQSEESWMWVGSKDNKHQKKCGSQKAAESALKYTRTKLHLPDIEHVTNTHLRVFSNCTVDLRTGEQLKHSPTHYISSGINAEYKKNAPLPDIFRRFILSSFGEDMINPIRAGISMLIDPTAPWGHFLHLIGPTGTGKGAFIRFCQSLFGNGNYGSGGTFSVFLKPETRYQELLGKALYCIPDIAGFQSAGLTEFYELVDNGSLSVRPLFASNAPSVELGLRFVIGSTDYLPVQDTKGGWGRRSIPIPTRRRKDNESIDNLEANLANARADVISWALAMDVEERNRIIKKPGQENDRIKIVIEESANFADSVRSFADRCLAPKPFIANPIAEPTVDKTTLWEWYKAYCTATGHRPKGLDAFTSSLKDTIPNHYQPRRRMRVEETDIRGRDGKPPMSAPKWTWLQAIPDLFEVLRDDDGNDLGVRCIGTALRDGQLLIFEDWEPAIDPKDRANAPKDQGGSGQGKILEPLPYMEGSHGSGGSGQNLPGNQGGTPTTLPENSPDPCDPCDPSISTSAFSDPAKPRSSPILEPSPDPSDPNVLDSDIHLEDF